MNGDAETLRALLCNLLDNAVKCTPNGGRVDVGLWRRGAMLCLQVADSGPGIPEAERERVFDRFYRVSGAAAAGPGFGLAIVKAIADSHHATLALGRSERLGGLRRHGAPGRAARAVRGGGAERPAAHRLDGGLHLRGDAAVLG